MSEVATVINVETGTVRANSSVSAELLAAAFGPAPDARVGIVGTPWDRWLAAVVLGGRGRYAAAAGLLKPLAGGQDPVLAGLASATLASHLRQIGGHAQARRHDSAALARLAPVGTAGRATQRDDRYGIGHAGALADALLGLTADAIGLRRLDEAAVLHKAAVAAAGPEPSWRITVRIDWVAAELALATDRPGVALDHATHARAVATEHDAVRHVTKSIMIAGAAAASGGTPDGRREARALLTEAVAVSLTRGIVTLVWPSALLLADLAPDQAPNLIAHATKSLTSVFSGCNNEMRRILRSSPWIPGTLIRSGEPTRTGHE